MATFLIVMAWFWGYCLIGTVVGVIGHSVSHRVGLDGEDAGITAVATGGFWPIGMWVLAAMALIHQGNLRRERKHVAALQRAREEKERAKLVEMGKREIEAWVSEHRGLSD